MQRRTDRMLTPQALFEAVHYQPQQWPGKTVRLERDSLADYRQRPGSPDISPAELYHENSKLTARHRGELAAARIDADGLRRELARRESWPDLPELPVDRALGAVLAGVAAAEPALFYAIELRLAVVNAIGRYDPGSGRVHLVRPLSVADRRALLGALLVLGGGDEVWPAAVLFVVGRFARNDVLYGPRGYRRTLLEAGQVTREVVRQAARLGWAARPRFEFVDTVLDDLLEADGVEEGTLVAVPMGDGDVGQG